MSTGRKPSPSQDTCNGGRRSHPVPPWASGSRESRRWVCKMYSPHPAFLHSRLKYVYYISTASIENVYLTIIGLWFPMQIPHFTGEWLCWASVWNWVNGIVTRLLLEPVSGLRLWLASVVFIPNCSRYWLSMSVCAMKSGQACLGWSMVVSIIVHCRPPAGGLVGWMQGTIGRRKSCRWKWVLCDYFGSSV